MGFAILPTIISNFKKSKAAQANKSDGVQSQTQKAS
jgi:hypothetical protein